MKITTRRLAIGLLAGMMCFPALSHARKRDRDRKRYDLVLIAQREPDAMAAKPGRHAPLMAAAEHPGVSHNYAWASKEGIDVSHYQGSIDWDAVAAGENISYAYLKATEGATLVDDTYARNLAEGARIEASNTRGGDRRYAAANLLDDDFDSYWATDDTVRSATLTLRFDAPRTFNRVQLQEYIPLGQRITRFRIETLDAAGNWCEAARETTVGYKRIVPIARTTTAALRISIDGALACPVLNGVGLYLDEVTLDAPLAERDKQGRITLTAPAGAEIRYTTDGTAPTASSPLYEGPITEMGPCRLQALALDGKRSSSVASYEWDIAPAAFRIVAPEGADGAADGLSDDGAEPLTRGALLDAAQPLVLDLGKVHRLTGCFYEPLAEGRGGCLVRYDLSVSRDGRTWSCVRSGALFDNIINSPGRRTVPFDAPLDVRYLRLTPVETGSSPTYGVGEFGVLTR